MANGQKRQRSETPSEQQTPSKRFAMIEAGVRMQERDLQASGSLSPEAREKRNRMIQAGLNSVPSTPSRHAPGSSHQTTDTRFRPAHPVGIERRNLFPPSMMQTPAKPVKVVSNKELDEEEAFWMSPETIPARVQAEASPRSGPSSAGYYPANIQSVPPRAGASRDAYHNSMPTPPRSSPPIEDLRAVSPSSMTQVSDLLRRSPDFESFHNKPTGREDYPTAHREPETPSHNRVAAMRGGSATPGPLTPSKSIDTVALRGILKGMIVLESLPDDVDKLKRKLRASELSDQKKQERIRRLEEELQSLQRKCEHLETTIASLETRR